MPDDLTALAADLAKSAAKASVTTRAVVQAGAKAIKDTAVAATPRQTGGLAASLTYDTKTTPTGAEAEIGFDKNRRHGFLGHLYEYGSVKHAPVNMLGAALDTHGPDVERALAQLARGLL